MRNGIFKKKRSENVRSGPLSVDTADCLAIPWCSVKRQIRLSYQNIAEILRGCVLNSPYPSNPSDSETV